MDELDPNLNREKNKTFTVEMLKQVYIRTTNFQILNRHLNETEVKPLLIDSLYNMIPHF